MTAPLVSVVIPCYNGSAYLAGCIGSVIDQNTPCEIIVVDDGSTDESIEGARRHLADCPLSILLSRMIITGMPNQGPAAARNTGLRAAQGKYVCFLDVDDQYASGFFAAALPIMESDPSVVGVSSEIELVNAHRAVERWQREPMENSLPGNIVMRTETVRQIGGFPVAQAFRGEAAGEDFVFRWQLRAHGKEVKLQKPFYKYLVRPGSHFDFWLDRATLRDGRIEFSKRSKEEIDGSLDQAVRQYEAEVQSRAVARTVSLLEPAFDAARQCLTLAQEFAPVEGFLHPFEGFVLYWLARRWPVVGRAVEIGSFKGRSTCWLAAGCREGNRSKVAAVDHFHGSPEHQRGGSHEDPVIAAGHSTLDVFKANLEKHGLTDWVTVHVGSAATVSVQWQEPVRLLFIDGDHSYEATAQDFAAWSRFVVPHGLVLFHDVGVWPGVTRFVAECSAAKERWRNLGLAHSLAILERLA
jgi:glycosyltransferase involved in cell wall biosynthesis